MYRFFFHCFTCTALSLLRTCASSFLKGHTTTSVQIPKNPIQLGR